MVMDELTVCFQVPPQYPIIANSFNRQRVRSTYDAEVRILLWCFTACEGGFSLVWNLGSRVSDVLLMDGGWMGDDTWRICLDWL